MKNESTESKNARGGSGDAADSPKASEARASERTGTTTSKRAKAKQRRRRPKKVKAAATALDQSKTPVTEKPVPLSAPEKTSQYLITIDNATGMAAKIEKLDPSTGNKKELSQAEYLQLVSSNANPLPVSNFQSPGGSGAPAGDNAALTEAYYRGVVDYLNALGLT